MMKKARLAVTVATIAVTAFQTVGFSAPAFAQTASGQGGSTVYSGTGSTTTTPTPRPGTTTGTNTATNTGTPTPRPGTTATQQPITQNHGLPAGATGADPCVAFDGTNFRQGLNNEALMQMERDAAIIRSTITPPPSVRSISCIDQILNFGGNLFFFLPSIDQILMAILEGLCNVALNAWNQATAPIMQRFNQAVGGQGIPLPGGITIAGPSAGFQAGAGFQGVGVNGQVGTSSVSWYNPQAGLSGGVNLGSGGAGATFNGQPITTPTFGGFTPTPGSVGPMGPSQPVIPTPRGSPTNPY